MSLRARLLLAVVVANLVAFAVLAVAVARDLDRRERVTRAAEERFRRDQVDRVADVFIAWFRSFDFDLGAGEGARTGRLVREVLSQPFWASARDAYLTDQPFRLDPASRPRAGELELNPIGAPDPESEELRKSALDLVLSAYRDGEVKREGEVLALPLYRRAGQGREKVGAAYIRVDVPSYPRVESRVRPFFVAFAIGGATTLAVVGLYLLLHWLVLKPLAAIDAGAKRVSQGDFGRPVPRSGRGDEIDDLIDAFNRMTAEVGQAREDLERRVAEAVARVRATEKRLLLSERLAAMGTLAAGIAHEINNPLGGMMNAVRALERPELPPESRRRYLALVSDGLARVRDVTSRVLRFAPRSRAADAVPLAALIDDVARFAQHRLRERGGALEIDVAQDLRVQGDAAALGQVFLNLIGNAIDAAQTAPPRIAIRARHEEGAARVEVEDHGSGMTPEQLARAFDPFFTTKEPGAGTGLGLFLVHQIVTEHGGTVEARSEPGRGTTFTLVLPAAGQGR